MLAVLKHGVCMAKIMPLNSAIPEVIRIALAGSIAARDMWEFWVEPSDLLGGLTPQQYCEQMGKTNLIIAIQNGLAEEYSSDDNSEE